MNRRAADEFSIIDATLLDEMEEASVKVVMLVAH
jgi:hypothetical protein